MNWPYCCHVFSLSIRWQTDLVLWYFVNSCQNNYWQNLLFINNYVKVFEDIVSEKNVMQSFLVYNEWVSAAKWVHSNTDSLFNYYLGQKFQRFKYNSKWSKFIALAIVCKSYVIFGLRFTSFVYKKWRLV